MTAAVRNHPGNRSPSSASPPPISSSYYPTAPTQRPLCPPNPPPPDYSTARLTRSPHRLVQLVYSAPNHYPYPHIWFQVPRVFDLSCSNRQTIAVVHQEIGKKGGCSRIFLQRGMGGCALTHNHLFFQIRAAPSLSNVVARTPYLR
ncbi:hypothetical protein EV2_012050 [Malus domestica]